MSTHPEPEFNLTIPRKNMLSAILLVIVLISSLFIYVSVINKGSNVVENTPKPEGSISVTTMPPITGTTVSVKNENELKNAIKNTPNGGSTTIALYNDITLTGYILIPVDKDITITSNRSNGFYKLIGDYSGDIITRPPR